MTLYICRKTNYGANGNFTRYDLISEYSEEGLGNINQVQHYKTWCWIFISCILFLTVHGIYWVHKSESCMTDGKIQEYFKSHAN